MRKLYIVKNKRDFDRIIKLRNSVANNTFVIYKEKNNLPFDRFGISVGKKTGNAVTRNFYKRKLRAIIDSYRKENNSSMDYIVILRGSAKASDYERLNSDFLSLINKMKEDKNEK